MNLRKLSLQLLPGFLLLFVFVKRRIFRRRVNNEEMLPLVNSEGEVIGKARRSICHANKNYLHPVVHLHVINSNGEIYLQKRPVNKIQPGKWDTAVGGHIAFGENVDAGLQREAVEELGIKDFKVKQVAQYIWESDIEREFVFCFITHYDGGTSINKEELADGKFWSYSEIKNNIGTGIFTPNFEAEINKIYPFLQTIK